MKSFALSLIFVLVSQIGLMAQDNQLLRVEMKRNILGQKIEILSGSQVVQKDEVALLMASDSEALFLYQKARRKQNLTSALKVAEVGLFGASAYFALAPQPQNSALNNLFLPISLGSLAVALASGAFSRQATNLTMEAVELYNFGKNPGAPVYFEENRIDQTLFSFKIPIN